MKARDTGAASSCPHILPATRDQHAHHKPATYSFPELLAANPTTAGSLSVHFVRFLGCIPRGAETSSREKQIAIPRGSDYYYQKTRFRKVY